MKVTSLAALRGMLAMGAAVAITCSAQEFPAKPVAMVVPNTPGTTLDLAARVAAVELAKFLGQPVVIENRPGADGAIGLRHVARQVPADGYTLAAAFVTTLATLPLTSKGLQFDPLRDLTPVSGLVEGRYVLASPSSAPWTTFQQLVAYGKQNPGKLNWGSPSANTRLVTEALVRGVGIETTYIPYSSGAQYLQAIATGDLHLGFSGEAILTQFGNKIRPIGVTGTTRMAKYPEVPTFNELGLPQIAGLSVSLSVRAGTSPRIVERLHAAASAMLKSTEARTRYAAVGFTPVDESPEEASRRLRDEAGLYAEIARKVGIEPQ